MVKILKIRTPYIIIIIVIKRNSLVQYSNASKRCGLNSKQVEADQTKGQSGQGLVPVCPDI